MFFFFGGAEGGVTPSLLPFGDVRRGSGVESFFEPHGLLLLVYCITRDGCGNDIFSYLPLIISIEILVCPRTDGL